MHQLLLVIALFLVAGAASLVFGSRKNRFTLFCRFVLCEMGLFFFAVAIDDYRRDGDWSWISTIFCIGGSVFMGLGIFTKAKTCEKILERL